MPQSVVVPKQSSSFVLQMPFHEAFFVWGQYTYILG